MHIHENPTAYYNPSLTQIMVRVKPRNQSLLFLHFLFHFLSNQPDAFHYLSYYMRLTYSSEHGIKDFHHIQNHWAPLEYVNEFSHSKI